MTVLVTGGAGYIGSHTVRLLRERGRSVVVLDSLESGHRAAVLDAAFVEANVGDEAAVARIVREYEVDAVVHFAAYKAVGESMVDPGRYFRNNVGRSATLIECVQRLGVERFVFSSTCAVYGSPEDVPVDESAAIRPESPYGETKAMVERMLSWYDQCSNLRSISLRYFNAAGAWPDGSIGEDWSGSSNLVPHVMRAALGAGSLEIYGTDYPTPDGTAIRDYVHVLDLAEAHVRALEVLEDGGATTSINVGTGSGASVLEVLRVAEEVVGRPIPYVARPRRPGDPTALFSNPQRSSETLRWSARSLRDILESAWVWHSRHPEGYSG